MVRLTAERVSCGHDPTTAETSARRDESIATPETSRRLNSHIRKVPESP